MNTETKDFFMENIESANTGEEEIILASPAELTDEAQEIAQSTKSDEKYPFTLYFDANQKDFLLSMLHTVGAIVETNDEDVYILNTRMNMTQLELIKRLDCVERVQTDEGNLFIVISIIYSEIYTLAFILYQYRLETPKNTKSI